MAALLEALRLARENWRIRQEERRDTRVLEGDALVLWIRVKWGW